MVVDSSAILAVIFKERYGEWVIERLKENNGSLLMSTVNLAETLIRIRSKQPNRYKDLKARLMDGSIQFIAPDVEQVEIVSEARHRFSINLGDCFVYALSKKTAKPVLTLDADFKQTDISILYPQKVAH